MKIFYLFFILAIFPHAYLFAACLEEKTLLHTEFVPGDFEKRFTIGRDEVEPVKVKIEEFIKAHPEQKVTDVLVAISSPKLPVYKQVNGKKVIDPESETKNLTLLKERAFFTEKALKEIKVSEVSFKTITELTGPDFVPLDLNTRFVTHMTPGYEEQVKSVFSKSEKAYREKALVKNADELLDEKKFGNLFQVKFKPFQGFRIEITGIRECKEVIPVSEKEKVPGASKQ